MRCSSIISGFQEKEKIQPKKLVPVLFLLTISIGFHKVQADTQHNFNIEDLQKKAGQGDPKAQFNLGIAYANG